MVPTRRLSRRRGLTPVYTYLPPPGAPPIATVRLDHATVHRVGTAAHTHDFPMLTYFTRGGGTLSAAGRTRRIEAGDLYVIAPGDVVGVGNHDGLASAEGMGVIFTPDALRSDAPGSLLSWRSHPLLLPFVRGSGGGVLQLAVPPTDRERWAERIAALDRELRERRDGHWDAALAHLTLLLVEVSRLAVDVVGDLRLNDEPLLAEVFAVIERRYAEQLSLRDVARAVNLSAGHVTTTVRRRTARTVQDWITERRMAQARRLLVETDLSIAAVGRQAGYPDPGYFARSFRTRHGVSPRGYRRQVPAGGRDAIGRRGVDGLGAASSAPPPDEPAARARGRASRAGCAP